MMTRRTVVGAGLGLAVVASTAGFGAYGAAARYRTETRSIDALLIDETIEMPGAMAQFIAASRRTLPVVGIRLDAAGHGALMRVFNRSQSLIGISSGATLFCLERLAWDHGLRLTGSSQRCTSSLGVDASRLDVTAFLGAARSPSSTLSPLARAYRPSRTDGTLHAWAMQKSARPQVRQDRREV